MKAQAIEEHLFAEDVHFFNSDEQGNRTGPNNRAGQRSNSGISQLGLHMVNIYIINYLLICQVIVYIYKMSKYSKNCFSQAPRTLSDIFKLLVFVN